MMWSSGSSKNLLRDSHSYPHFEQCLNFLFNPKFFLSPFKAGFSILSHYSNRSQKSLFNVSLVEMRISFTICYLPMIREFFVFSKDRLGPLNGSVRSCPLLNSILILFEPPTAEWRDPCRPIPTSKLFFLTLDFFWDSFHTGCISIVSHLSTISIWNFSNLPEPIRLL